MGVVHLARAEDGERVALKVLRPHVVGDDEARERLAREVKSLSRVRSPRVAEIIDADPWGPVPFVATRYVPGRSLHDEIKEAGPLSPAELRGFARGLVEALAAVHAVGVTHRDIKPSNVLIEDGEPVLIDFGLARVADDATVTQTGWLLGTPGYLAPEILYGDPATAASDVHSLAATLAYAGTGRSPFGSGPSAAVMDRVRRGEHDLSGMPEELRRIVHACLDPEPSRRPTLAMVGGWLAEDPDEDPDEDASGSTRLLQASEPWRSAPVRWPVRVRAGLLLCALAVTLGVGVAVAPYPAAIAVVAVVWLVRALHSDGEAAAALRRLRGRRWYDGPRALLVFPWHTLRALPGAAVLVLWAAGIGLAVLLPSLYFGLDAAVHGAGGVRPGPVSLALSATAAMLALWVGPGSDRVRRPLGGAARTLSRAPWPWFVSSLLLLVAAGLSAWLAMSGGSLWWPADDPPFTRGTFPRTLLP